ncbi:hypothetical protein Leryth_017876 [Lithospermum erythrorhizon]|nr:hypothetical protein Leryth_017876 [Lithospermum erythrorhizon]
MGEEFQECEVMFQQEDVVEVNKETNKGSNDELYSREFKNCNNGSSSSNRGAKRKKLNKNKTCSLPLKIPDGNRWFEYVDYDDHEYGGGGGEFVPPHLIIRQRLAGEMMEFSVCVGKGRTLKGRDLRQVRNSILRMTGFLES